MTLNLTVLVRFIYTGNKVNSIKAFNKKRIRLNEHKIRRGNSKIVCAVEKLQGISRKVVVLGVYLPPKTRSQRVKETMEHINNVIGQLKRDMNDPIFIIGGDFNKFETEDAVADYPDLQEIITPPTRGDNRLDLIFTNIN